MSRGNNGKKRQLFKDWGGMLSAERRANVKALSQEYDWPVQETELR